MDAQAACVYFTSARVAQLRGDGEGALESLPVFLEGAPLSAGYAVQDAMIDTSAGAESPLGKLVGWKIGATNSGSQVANGFSAPFYGPLFQSALYDHGASLWLPSLGVSFKAAEAEFCFLMGADLSGPGPFSEADCWAAVDSLYPAIELAASRLTSSTPPVAILADGAFSGAVVLASSKQHFHTGPGLLGGLCEYSLPKNDFDPALLPTATAELWVDGVKVASSDGANVLGSPLTALTWLANALAAAGHSLRKGQYVMTGACCAVKGLTSGQTLEARFAIHDYGWKDPSTLGPDEEVDDGLRHCSQTRFGVPLSVSLHAAREPCQPPPNSH